MDLLLHLDEIFLKGKNQNFFIRKLTQNLESLFKKTKAARVEGGIILRNFSEGEMARLSLVPGIANFAPALVVGSEPENIQKGINELIGSLSFSKKTKFRVSAERSFKQYPFTSAQMQDRLGDYIRKKTGWGVALKNFDVEICVSVGKDRALIYANPRPGAGGLPTGSSGKILCLLSGGLDSPVAAYKMMKRGAEVVLIHFQNQTAADKEVGQKIMDLANVLSRYQPRVKLFMAPFANLQKEVIMKVPSQYRMLATRRLFNKIAERIARQEGCLALATGDSLGQVASQTLENLNVINSSLNLLSLAPLIGENKSEITALARKISTFDISIRPYEDCCSLFVAKHPETKARLKDILQYEKGINLDALDTKQIISYYIGKN
ncbi:tRNA 4-thiouridine(8) synthase ThiI [Patescibacteria group bacterium]|nr:MAG: tRNA 4-thiouridine(8) synthase ThiI [Patescibacteria group bacterium]